MSRPTHALIALVVSAGFTAPVAAAEKDCARNSAAAPPGVKAPAAMPAMTDKMPMQTEMAKPGTMQMDVSEAAAAKDDCMRPMLEKEQGTMDTGKAQPGKP